MLQRLLAERRAARLGMLQSPPVAHAVASVPPHRLNAPVMTPAAIREEALKRARAGELDPVTRDLVGELMDQHGMVSFWRQLPPN